MSNLEKRKEKLRGIVDLEEMNLAKVPDGKLLISTAKGKPRYYLRYENKKKYLNQKNKELIKALAQKEYDSKVLICAIKELNALNRLLNCYELGTAEDVFVNMHPARQKLITPIMLPDDEFVKNWLAQPYEGMGFEEGAPEFYSDSGLRVRSKSEIGIANKYNELQIPMLFERPLKLKGWGTVYPDFTLLNVRLRKEFIHEHMGMMDDPEYLEDNIGKIHAYEKNGFFPGKNLILTFETRKNPFDARKIEDIAKQYLL